MPPDPLEELTLAVKLETAFIQQQDPCPLQILVAHLCECGKKMLYSKKKADVKFISTEHKIFQNNKTFQNNLKFYFWNFENSIYQVNLPFSCLQPHGP